jgi:hypothetical protein
MYGSQGYLHFLLITDAANKNFDHMKRLAYNSQIVYYFKKANVLLLLSGCVLQTSTGTMIFNGIESWCPNSLNVDTLFWK